MECPDGIGLTQPYISCKKSFISRVHIFEVVDKKETFIYIFFFELFNSIWLLIGKNNRLIHTYPTGYSLG